MKNVLLIASLMSLGVAGTTFAQTIATAPASSPVADKVVSDLQAQGYTRIEIDQEGARIEVDAFNGTTKFEGEYDATTGALLSKMEGTADADEDTTPGVFHDSDDDGENGENDSN